MEPIAEGDLKIPSGKVFRTYHSEKQLGSVFTVEKIVGLTKTSCSTIGKIRTQIVIRKWTGQEPERKCTYEGKLRECSFSGAGMTR